MKITKKMLKEQFGNTRLEKYVLNDILSDIKGYTGTFEERLKTRLKEITQHGCVSGTVSLLIYNSDCKKFYIKFIDDITELISDCEEETGAKFENKQDLPIYTFYSWVAYEEIAYRIRFFLLKDNK